MIIFEKDNLGRSIIEIVFKNRGSIFAKEGVAFFLAHIFNTKGSLNKKERFYSQIEEHAIQFSANVNKEFFTLSLKFLNDKEKKALNYFKEILLNPNITKENFEKSVFEDMMSVYNDEGYIFSNVNPEIVPVGEDSIDVNFILDQTGPFF